MPQKTLILPFEAKCDFPSIALFPNFRPLWCNYENMQININRIHNKIRLFAWLKNIHTIFYILHHNLESSTKLAHFFPNFSTLCRMRWVSWIAFFLFQYNYILVRPPFRIYDCHLRLLFGKYYMTFFVSTSPICQHCDWTRLDQLQAPIKKPYILKKRKWFHEIIFVNSWNWLSQKNK